eukprot:m.144973 g.144973  ORF g.144973 m.144973 type:complete len:288 (+) comp52672_c0_seq6:84-947(+)
MVRLVRFEHEGRVRVGAATASHVADITAVDSSIPNDTAEVLALGAPLLAKIQAIVESGAAQIPLADVTLKAPIVKPDKIICIGLNYVDHCTEQNVPVPKEPVVFSKFSSCITDPGQPILLPAATKELDFEVELAIVIGKTAKRVKAENAMEYVGGYTVAHDVSARDWQLKRNGGQWLLGKTFDTFAPIGPAIVTRDSISDPHNLGIRCRLNGATVQDSNTNQLVFKTEAIIEWLSALVTLLPGDLILTGTPPGVGCFRKPPLWLKDGDVVECEIDEIGTISNPVKAD